MQSIVTAFVTLALAVTVVVLMSIVASRATPYQVRRFENGTQVWRGLHGVKGPRDFVVTTHGDELEIREVEDAVSVRVQDGVVTYGHSLSSVKRRFHPDESSIEVEIKAIDGSLRQRLVNDLKVAARSLALVATVGLLVLPIGFLVQAGLSRIF